jgi:hypothetical protein
MTNLQICRTYTLAAAASQGPESEIRGSCVGGPGFNSQMNRFSQISRFSDFDQVAAGRVRRLLTNERRYGAIAVSPVEVPNELRDVFVNRSGGF